MPQVLLSCIGQRQPKLDGSRLTDVGWKLTQLPLHPHLAHLRQARGSIIDDMAAVVAALLSERDILQNGRAFLKDPHRDKAASAGVPIDPSAGSLSFCRVGAVFASDLSPRSLDTGTLVRSIAPVASLSIGQAVCQNPPLIGR